ncbi:hypothetical protein M378DRAFT_164936 [Amanita muscaria Koide BX008]|uniref:Uncharacterized protein n=1 Tax=Amanita muscaria (strain Koide BX008) TaxID=946122 RepID=A0A0C2SIQ5_AMAMK|nr:hypothetical protein M378DRAFT_164936 [Amanita muscaria Koide BX008]
MISVSSFRLSCGGLDSWDHSDGRGFINLYTNTFVVDQHLSYRPCARTAYPRVED